MQSSLRLIIIVTMVLFFGVKPTQTFSKGRKYSRSSSHKHRIEHHGSRNPSIRSNATRQYKNKSTKVPPPRKKEEKKAVKNNYEKNTSSSQDHTKQSISINPVNHSIVPNKNFPKKIPQTKLPFIFAQKTNYQIAPRDTSSNHRPPHCRNCTKHHQGMRPRPCHNSNCRRHNAARVIFHPGELFFINGIYYFHHYCDSFYCYYYNLWGPYDDFYYCAKNVCHYCNDESCFNNKITSNEVAEPYFEDPGLERCIRESTGRLTGTLNQEDLQKIENLSCIAYDIASLQGLSDLYNLKTLDISKNCIDDFSILKSMAVTQIEGIATQHPSFCKSDKDNEML